MDTSLNECLLNESESFRTAMNQFLIKKLKDKTQHVSVVSRKYQKVIEQRLRTYLETIRFLNKHQSRFRRTKSADDHLFRLSQSIMESFNRGEHVVAAFLHIEKAFDNV